MKTENRLSAGLKNCDAPDDGEQGFILEACELIFNDFGSDNTTITTTTSDTVKTKSDCKVSDRKMQFCAWETLSSPVSAAVSSV